MRPLLLMFLLLGLRTMAPIVAGETGLPKAGTLDGLGVNIHFTHAKAGELEMLAAGSFRFVRMDFFWGGIEKQKGVYDFSAFDHLLADLDRVGLRAYFILDYGNRLYDDGLSPHSDAGRAAFCAFVKAALQRYAGRGIVWEMWNEPNHAMFWKPQPKVEDYAKLALAVGETVREVAPQEVLVGPTTSEIDLPFIEACFAAGCLSFWDAVSVHPYRQSPPETAAGEYRALRGLIRRHLIRIGGDRRPGPPILSGEWGYSSAKLMHGGFDETQQGRYLPRQWLSNIANGIPISIWYDWHDDGDDRSNPEHNFGTVRRTYRQGQAEVYEPKPAYIAAKTLTTLLKGYEFSKALALADDEHVLLFARGDQVRLAAWTSAVSPRVVTIPANAGRFRVTGHLGAELPEAAADAAGLQLTLTPEVQYLAPIEANPSLRLAVAWERLPLEVLVTAPQPGELVRTEDHAGRRVVLAPAAKIHQLTSRFTNPLERTVEWRVRADHPDEREVLSGTIKVAPGATEVVEQALVIGERMAIHPPVAIPLTIDGAVVWSQATRLVMTNPVELQVLCPIKTDGGLFLPLHVDNRRGTEFRADFVIAGMEPLTGTRRTIPAGQETVVNLPLPRDPGTRFTAMITARDPTNREIIRSLPERTYRAVSMKLDEWAVHADGVAEVASTQALAESQAVMAPGLAPQPVIDLSYTFAKGWKFLRIAPEKPIELGNTRAIGMWVHGDGSGNVVRLRLVDAGGQTFQPDGGRLDFTGWKWLTFTLTPHTAHWGGANDGVPKAPLRLDTLFLLDQADQSKPSQGVVRIAGAMAVE